VRHFHCRGKIGVQQNIVNLSPVISPSITPLNTAQLSTRYNLFSVPTAPIATRILIFDPRRIAFLIFNSDNSANPMFLSPNSADLQTSHANGIRVEPGAYFSMSLQLHGSMVWGPWFCESTIALCRVYESYMINT